MNERIKKLRKALDLTQQAFADRLGIKQNTIAKYETNRGSPTTSVVALIVREFGVSEEWLRTGKGEMFAPTPETAIDKLVDEFNLDSLDREIVSEFVKLDEKSREAVKLYIKKVARHLYPNVPAFAPATEKAQAQTGAQADLDREADEFAAMAREMFISKKQQEASKASSLQKMTNDELHAELDRQLLIEKVRQEKSQASQDFNSNGTKMA